MNVAKRYWGFAAGGVVLATAAAFVLHAQESEPVAPRSDDGPVLFGEPQSCRREGASAEIGALEGERKAQAKMERFPFSPRDGVDAVRLVIEAADCWAQAGKTEEARRVETLRGAWAERVTRSFRGRRLQLRRALADGRQRDALATVHALEELLRHDQGPGRKWIRRVRRDLQGRVSP